jgi:hypothetical protein
VVIDGTRDAGWHCGFAVVGPSFGTLETKEIFFLEGARGWSDAKV